MTRVPGFPFRSKFHVVDGVRLAYVEQGKGEPVVLLHGNPTWGYLYRKFIPPLAKRSRVIVPDHMGFGCSDKPLDPSLYRLARHIANLESLLLRLDVRNATLVMQDWGGPIGLGVATRNPDRVKRLVILNTWAWVIPAGTRVHPLLEQFRTPGLGEALVQGLNLFVEGFLPAGIAKKERVTQALMRAYRDPFPDWNSRVGILAFPRDIVVGDDHPSARAMSEIQQKLPTLEVPVLLIWAMKDHAFPKGMIELWQKIYPHAELRTLADAGHYLQEDEPEVIVGLIQDFLQRHP
ncbi:MAG: alpha/beta fold hydrolase [Candidatus Rokubacteria bacterium]|nr:alpha/beta fold hydrolase [Candidatus Rokubacteria bacterium]